MQSAHHKNHNPLLAELMTAAKRGAVLRNAAHNLLGFSQKSPEATALTKRLKAANRTYDQWAHSMIVAPAGEIQLHNQMVKRRNFRFAVKKGLV